MALINSITIIGSELTPTNIDFNSDLAPQCAPNHRISTTIHKIWSIESDLQSVTLCNAEMPFLTIMCATEKYKSLLNLNLFSRAVWVIFKFADSKRFPWDLKSLFYSLRISMTDAKSKERTKVVILTLMHEYVYGWKRGILDSKRRILDPAQ